MAWLAVVIVLVASACDPATPSGAPSSTASPSVPATTSPPSASAAVPSASIAPPSASPNAEIDAIYDAVEEQVIAIRGLKPVRPVERQFLSEPELRAAITKLFDEETPPAYLAANDRLYKALGLIPTTSNLRDLTLELLSGAVAGFYRSDQGKLYLVSKTGTPGPTERMYFAHEYDHALQDQNSTIFKDQDGVLDQGDRIGARQAIYEGDATLLMSQWAASNLSQAELLEALSSGSDPDAVAALTRAPAILRETLLFPYNNGFLYVRGVQASGGWPAVNAYFKAMPESTEQILHPEKYTAGERPVKVTLPADLATRLGAGWTVPLQDTFGEYQLGIWLRENGVDTAVAKDPSAGWGGDRLAVMEGPQGAWGVVLETTWDTETDANEFTDAAQAAVDGLPHKADISTPTAKGITILIASDDATLQALDVIFGATGV